MPILILTTGSRLGPYLVGPRLGAGGMGEVYRATDPRLARDPAIKALPPQAGTDPGASVASSARR
ncbi:MAG TPA: hypothetical protein VLD67_00595 [Vicinamibacterales bacterium]|nr:hypothetical protein [Vicinamibacterales bacterium]